MTPDCFEGECLLGLSGPFDVPHSILEVRGLLVNLRELGLADRICKAYHVDREELGLLSVIETELRRLNPKNTAGDGTGDRSGPPGL